MATGIRPGLSRREQEKVRKDIQKDAKRYVAMMKSFITCEPVKLPYAKKMTLVIAYERGVKLSDLELLYRDKYPNIQIVIWNPTQYKAVQEQLNKIVPNLKTVEVAEDGNDAKNLVSEVPVDREKEAEDWMKKHKPKSSEETMH